AVPSRAVVRSLETMTAAAGVRAMPPADPASTVAVSVCVEVASMVRLPTSDRPAPSSTSASAVLLLARTTPPPPPPPPPPPRRPRRVGRGAERRLLPGEDVHVAAHGVHAGPGRQEGRAAVVGDVVEGERPGHPHRRRPRPRPGRGHEGVGAGVAIVGGQLQPV